MELTLHHDESRYAAFLLQEMERLEMYVNDLSLPSGIRRRAGFLLANIYFEIVRVTEPVITELFINKMGIICIG